MLIEPAFEAPSDATRRPTFLDTLIAKDYEQSSLITWEQAWADLVWCVLGTQQFQQEPSMYMVHIHGLVKPFKKAYPQARVQTVNGIVEDGQGSEVDQS